MRAFKERDVNAYVLHKQHLLEGAQGASVLEIVNALLALHATSATSPYLSLFVRMKQFQRSDLDRESYTQRNLIRLELMRGTLFITSTALAPLLFQATRIPENKLLEWIHKWGIPGSEYKRLEEYILSGLKQGGKTLQELKNNIPPQMVRTLERMVGTSVQRMTNVNILLSVLMRQGRVFSEKFAERILIRYANRYALIREVYPTLNLSVLSPEVAQTMLVKQYIGAFGPVTEQDISWWTGFTKTKTQEILAVIEDELQQLRIKKQPDTHFMLQSDYAIFKKGKWQLKGSVLLLPYEDPYTKGYRLRARLIDRGNEKQAYVGGAVEPTILVNGKIVGIWNRVFEEPGETITIQLFQRLSKTEKTAITHQAKSMGKMMTGKEFSVEFKSD